MEMKRRMVTPGKEDEQGQVVELKLDTDFSDVPDVDQPVEEEEPAVEFQLPPGFFEPVKDICIPMWKVTYLNISNRGTKNTPWRVNIHVENINLPFTKDFDRKKDAAGYMQDLMFQITKYKGPSK